MEAAVLLGPALASAGTWAASNALPILSTGLSVAGTLFEGQAADDAAKYEADQMKAQGAQELALAQQEAAAKRKEATLANSRNLAVAAGSGAGAADPTVIEIMSDVETQGMFNSLTELYKGFSRRSDLIEQAKNRRQEGKTAKNSSYLEAAGTVFSDASAAQRHRELMQR